MSTIEVPPLLTVVERVRNAAQAVAEANTAYRNAEDALRVADRVLRDAREEFNRARGAVLAAAIGEPDPDPGSLW